MTTIAYKDGILAGDTQADGGGVKYEVQKILVADFMTAGSSFYRARLCVAVAGRRDDGMRLFWHLQGSCRDLVFSEARERIETLQFDKALDIDPDDETSSFIVTLAGSPSALNSSATRPLIAMKRIGRTMDTIGPRGYHAIGSGRDFALAAMKLGRTPAKAVAISHFFDVGTGPGIQEVSVWPEG